jgi:Tetratricopeptide repeat
VAVPLGDAEPYYNLGSYHRTVDTPSAQAQLWFDRGMVWAYAFNHEEAVRCFEKALGLDTDLAIARWGIAYSVGPNYNKAWDAFDPIELAASLARARMELELAAKGRATATERGSSMRWLPGFPLTTPRTPKRSQPVTPHTRMPWRRWRRPTQATSTSKPSRRMR